MNQTARTSGRQTLGRQILDFLLGSLGGLIAGNLGLRLVAQIDPDGVWLMYFQWGWLLVLAGLAVFFYTRKRLWLSAGIATAMILMAL